ncbi:MAG: ATP-binding protein [Smithella sp.]|jgi:signal transduction histidine kinase
MLKKLFQNIIDFLEKLTVRGRLMLLIVAGLGLTMAIWGIIQLKALDGILLEQQVKRLEDVAETVSTFYQYFPTKRGLRALDSALKDHVQTDVRLARIDIFDASHRDVDYVAGAGRVQYEWPDNVVVSTAGGKKTRYVKIETESGPALGLLYPVSGETKGSHVVVGVIGFSRLNAEIMKKARQLLIFSSAGLLAFILFMLGLSYRWMIGKPMNLIIQTIDEFQKGLYKNRIPIVRHDEWGQISDHFNIMAGEIQDVMNRNMELNKHLEERVREETLKVVQLQKEVADLKQLTALGQLTANLAHDLGTPLHSIGGLASLLLERGGWPEDVAHKLNLIIQQTQRLNSVIQNVRKATRLPEPRFEVLTVQQILNETLPLVETFMRKNNVGISVDIEEGINPLYVDRYRIQTALMNIVQNALDAMPQGGEIKISVKAVSPQGLAAITISDTGTGMTLDVIEKVCEPFFSTRQDERLRGLGMAIVRNIIKVHGGTMEIKSAPGQGTTIILILPTVRRENA